MADFISFDVQNLHPDTPLLIEVTAKNNEEMSSLPFKLNIRTIQAGELLYRCEIMGSYLIFEMTEDLLCEA